MKQSSSATSQKQTITSLGTGFPHTHTHWLGTSDCEERLFLGNALKLTFLCLNCCTACVCLRLGQSSSSTVCCSRVYSGHARVCVCVCVRAQTPGHRICLSVGGSDYSHLSFWQVFCVLQALRIPLKPTVGTSHPTAIPMSRAYAFAHCDLAPCRELQNDR